MSTRLLRFRWVIIVILGFLASGQAAESPADSSKTDKVGAQASTAVTDPSYRLNSGDTILFGVYQQEDLAASQTIGRSGDVRLPLIKEEIILGGKTVREAERYLENLYREKKLLKAPVVSIKVAVYFPRVVSVLGAVRAPGEIPFPPDITTMDIVEVITKAGGFLPISKADSVTVTRRATDGKETSQTLDLENVISGRRRAGRDRAEFPVFPGDRIWVPERLF